MSLDRNRIEFHADMMMDQAELQRSDDVAATTVRRQEDSAGHWGRLVAKVKGWTHEEAPEGGVRYHMHFYVFTPDELREYLEQEFEKKIAQQNT